MARAQRVTIPRLIALLVGIGCVGLHGVVTVAHVIVVIVTAAYAEYIEITRTALSLAWQSVLAATSAMSAGIM